MRKRIRSQSLRRLMRRMRDHDGGIALLLAMFLAVVGAILMYSGTRLISQSSKDTLAENRTMIEADNAARAGITDALAWFRRQTAPVSQTSGFVWRDEPFYPRETTTPQVGKTPYPDTLDEDVGLVKEYRITAATQPGVPRWMRYEVRRQRFPTNVNGTPVVTPTGTIPATPAWTPAPWDKLAAHDITGERIPASSFVDGMGYVWQITSLGYVFQRTDDAQPFNVAPNKVLATSAIQTEFRKISVQFPNNLLSVFYTAGKLSGISMTVNSSPLQILGGCDNTSKNSSYTFLSTNASPGSLTVPSGARVSSDYGGTGTTTVSGGDLSPSGVFSYTKADLKNMADFSVVNPSEIFSAGVSTLPPSKFYYITPPSGQAATFTAAYPLSGGVGSLVFVDGNLVLDPGTTSSFDFSGILYVNGNLTVKPPLIFSGVVILGSSTSSVSLNPSNTNDLISFNYSADIVSQTMTQVAQYRENQGAIRRFTNLLYR